jgi:hypothetical protein
MIPPNFFKVVKDFIIDLFGTFPELKEHQDLVNIHDKSEADAMESYQVLFDTMVTTFPQHMMDILHEKESMFEKSCVLFPNVDFKNLWNTNITEKTKNIIWKYLKLLIFIVIGHMDIGDDFSKMLQGMDLQKSVEEIKTFFESTGGEMPDMHDHMEGLMNGKLGSLAKEIAQEVIGGEGEQEAFQSMMKDPSKLFGLMHTVGDKLDKRIKSGDLKESELISEAAEMLQKMKDMPGMKQFETMFNKFGKMNMNATQAKMDEKLKKAKTKERLKEKLLARQAQVKLPEPVQETPKKKKNKNKKNIHDVLDA